MMKKNLSREESIRAFEAALRTSAPLPTYTGRESIQESDRNMSQVVEHFSRDVICRVVERIKEL